MYWSASGLGCRSPDEHSLVSEPKRRSGTSVAEVAADYRKAAAMAGNIENSAQQRKWADRIHTAYRLLKESEDGRQAIATLMFDEDETVRLWAAGHSLQWDPVVARQVLEKLTLVKGLVAVSAKWTLREFDAGRLSFDYQSVRESDNCRRLGFGDDHPRLRQPRSALLRDHQPGSHHLPVRSRRGNTQIQGASKLPSAPSRA